MKLFFDCENCKEKVSVIDLYRSAGDFADDLCQKCYLMHGKANTSYSLEEAIYEVGLLIFSKQEIADGKEATLEDLERVIKLKAFL